MQPAGTVPDLPGLADASRLRLQQQVNTAAARLGEPQFTGLSSRIAALETEPRGITIADGVVHFQGSHQSTHSAQLAETLARELIPWRKGPFQLFDLYLDAEWRSDAKWNRIAPDLPDLKGKVIADVGCNNGYYLFQLQAAGAHRVIGFDPTLKYWLQYQLLAAHAPALPVSFLPLGWQALVDMPEVFDVLFLMGINYHEANLLDLLHTCRKALKPGGLLVCESVVVDADADFEIFPAGKYAGIGGVYAVPTPRALSRQLTSAGFQNVTVQHTARMTVAEQRRSEFSPQKSLADFITADGLSIEGYPPLYRSALLSYRLNSDHLR